MLEVQVKGDRVNVAFSRDLVSDKDLMDFIEKVRLKNLIAKSELTEEDAARLDQELKSEWWKRNRERLLAKFK
jgi:hypothetical protein